MMATVTIVTSGGVRDGLHTELRNETTCNGWSVELEGKSTIFAINSTESMIITCTADSVVQ